MCDVKYVMSSVRCPLCGVGIVGLGVGWGWGGVAWQNDTILPVVIRSWRILRSLILRNVRKCMNVNISGIVKFLYTVEIVDC